MGQTNTLVNLRKIVTRYRSVLRSYPNVTGIGYGVKVTEDEVTQIPCITLYVHKKVSEDKLTAEQKIPSKFENYNTDVIQANFRPYAAHQSRMRPAKPGCSIGHYNVTAGTFGLLTKDRKTKEPMILSNNHVLADSNNALKLDPILQPGAADEGEFLTDAIARLWRFVPIKFTYSYGTLTGTNQISTGINIVDCAIAKPLDPDFVEDEIIGIGKPEGVTTPQTEMIVQKSGRTTGHTTDGKIINTDAEVQVGFGFEGTALYQHQTVIYKKGFADGGDSGSCILDMENNAVALLHAGDEETTIGCNMKTVLDCLNIELF